MIIECTTLEQVKDVIRINKINECWNTTDLIRLLKEGSVCIRFGLNTCYSSRENYDFIFPELQIISYEEYIKSLNSPTPKIHLRHAIWDTTLIVQCLHCEPFEPVEKDGFELKYSDATLLRVNTVGLCSNLADTKYFSTPKEAKAYLDNLLELVKMVNKSIPVVDLSKVGSCKIENMTYITIGDIFVTLVKNGKCIAEYNKEKLSLPIIKAQLTQILSHLGVKVTITI